MKSAAQTAMRYRQGRIMKQRKKNEQAKYRMVEAIGRCMKGQPVENITVDQIAREAGLSRQTFYRHFKDKYDLINWYFDELLLESFDQMGSGRTVREGLQRKFTFIEKEHLFFYAAFKNDEQNNLKQHDFEMILDFYRNLVKEKGGKLTGQDDSLLEMYCQASVYMTVKWVLNNMPSSEKTLANLMIDAMPPKLRELFIRLELI